MAVKPNAQSCTILEQIITDPASGLTLQFERRDDGLCRLVIAGELLPFGNRDFLFDAEGRLGAAGTATQEICRPSWLKVVD